MKLPGWLWAWVRAYLDWIVTCTGFACGVLYLATGWVPFMVVATAVSAAVLAGLWAGKERLLRVWNRVPCVMLYRRRRHRKWQDHLRWIAARQKAGLGAFCWGKALSDVPERERGEFWRDIQRLNAELGRPAAPDKNRKEQQ